MRAFSPVSRALVVTVCVAGLAAGARAQPGPDLSAQRGRALYRDGAHADGRPLFAVTGEASMPLPAAFVACVKCHGHDARGKIDGGVATSDIRGETLAKPYAVTVPGGRTRAPYDEAAFFAAVTQGKDANGRALAPTMPRYRLSAAETSDLLAYLNDLERFTDEGVTPETIRIGFAIPAESDRQMLAAWFDRVNRRGGVFRRRIELVPVDSAGADAYSPEKPAPSVLAVLAGEDGGALAAAFCESRKIPFLRTTADSSAENSRYGFALYPGTVERARALARYAIAHDRSARPTLALLHAAERTPRALLDAVTAAIAAAQPTANIMPTPIDASATAGATASADAAVRALQAAGVRSALLLGGEGSDFAALLASAKRLGWEPLLLWPGASDLAAANVRVVGVRAALPADVSAEALEEYRQCAEAGNAPTAATEQDRARRIALLASARLLVTALENAGREVSREKLVETVESLREFRSGYAPAGGFSPRRRTAASGVYVVSLSPAPNRPEPEWLTLD